MVSLISTVDTGHEDMIHDAQMDFYGTRLATCSSDATVRIFSVRNGSQTLETELREHQGPVWQVAWAHPMYGALLASCSYDRRVIIWKETAGRWSRLHEYANHDSSVNSVCWAPYGLGLILACCGSDGSISVITYTSAGTWDPKKINNAHTIGCNAVSWAPEVSAGSVLENQPQKVQKRFVSGGCDNLVKIWREEEDQWVEEVKLDAHSDWVRDVAWAPSVGLKRQLIASCSQDRRVIIWENDGVGTSWTPHELPTFPDVIWHVSWSVAGNILAVSGGDNKATLWKETLEGKWVCLNEINLGKGSSMPADQGTKTL
ncbi:protein SEC13 homolog isoform X2 [Pollicipes pollicipes]|uniref:protein SEC13 homolog isoform X1 n=1 Tax=Pollicipes pollicipes TaxID=41117 RepID=UPI00188517A7|nr:protein SEC13 homolog isoform X1 [Pollicipes pollicipes]XP_037090605.1 protein SEC13 homolog isoform X1 [Pollicipes pollicipes]XP_037090607.1 protein SEC13 homolog isoform X1 [Pollicipes pollicipes]XP_037090608.1 protein SEC13 homolog isoform X2 [Pollicipes pollicipes]XP_037090609.1 protein SEC13 homolog isoform X1 [Pollicipes pollicipes]XP_037090610.1 protein SEC13 homolog isoform X1 [Pollicipes pollicipes]XP_037090611.1 protein SEC13 homolog isoform X1 [Pollicipes pollicipes]XP_03709061